MPCPGVAVKPSVIIDQRPGVAPSSNGRRQRPFCDRLPRGLHGGHDVPGVEGGERAALGCFLDAPHLSQQNLPDLHVASGRRQFPERSRQADEDGRVVAARLPKSG